MNTLIKRQLNLLVHLAEVDGKFDKSERKLLNVLVSKNGLTGKSLQGNHPVCFSEFTHSDNKVELLYWAFKLVQTDGIIHEKEVSFCRNMARKLNFKEEIVDNFLYKNLPEYDVFEIAVKRFSI